MTTNTQVTTAKPQQQSALDVVMGGLDTLHAGIVNDLKGSGIDPGKFLAAAKIGIQKSQMRDALLGADRNSLYEAVKDAAQQGLVPDGKEGVLIPYKGKERTTVSFQPMILGIVKLMRLSGEILDCGAYVVHKNDHFEFTLGVDKMPIHRPDWFGDRGEPVGAWAFVKLTNGEVISRMLPKDKIQRVAVSSKQPTAYSPTEGQAWEEFWQKAALRNAAKFAPKTPKLEAVLAKDDEEFDFTPQKVTNAPVITQKPKPETPPQTRASAAVAKRQQPQQATPTPMPAPVDAEYIENDLEPPM